MIHPAATTPESTGSLPDRAASAIKPHEPRVYLECADIARVSEVFERHPNGVYLVVGTIEPRKDCARILAAFERLWSEQSDAALMFFGRAGWRSYDLIDRIREHPEKGGRLFWFENGSDAELDFAYRRAAALIFASRHEGFGLPLVEAMCRGLPVLASDIPVFREIGGDYPEFFRPGDEAAIYCAVHRFADAQVSGPRRHSSPRSWPSWSESARVLREKVTQSRSEPVFPAAAQGQHF
jgi:alpha-1,2-rhamnosyltransferase